VGLIAPTGYGNQVKLFAPRLARVHDIAVSSFYGLEGSRLAWEGIQVFPGLGGEFGNAYLIDHAKRWFEGEPRDGLVLTLLDVWVLHTQIAAQLDMACWVPVDHDPAPPAVERFFRESGAIPIAMSRFGERLLEEFDPLYVPHGVDFETFRPHDRAAAREATGVDPDAFLIGVVAANKGAPSRKCFQEILQAFALFRERHEDAFLYLHTIIDPNHAQGEDIGSLMLSLGLPENSVLIADQYRMAFNPHPAETMARIYSTFDVLLNPAAGEGFGIPVLEAQSVGVPAIVTDFSAMKEVCGAGWKVAYRSQWTGQRSWQARPDVPDIVHALDECYGLSKAKRETLSKRAREHARQYAADRVMERHMLPALEEIEKRLAARKPSEILAA
jgi:glycosyltransferase involved in cell wall biosynthesis